jgi:tRNA-Thr(GGU) m(6)t(6)A37 methyltransferase TsaA
MIVNITYQSIGVISTPFQSIEGMPIQTIGAVGIRGRVQIWPEFAAGLKDLEGFSHIILLYHFHHVKGAKLQVTPFLDSEPRGLFATRAPRRPNPIGLSVVRLLQIQDNVIEVENVDMLDGTPLLDIKPYVPAFDVHSVQRVGWLAQVQDQANEKRSDERFR